MSKLIVVCGLGGTGKTTTAQALSKKLNIICLHKDKIKAAIQDTLGITTPNTINLLLKLTEEQLELNVDLIIEGTFNYKEDTSIFENWQKKYHVDLFFIICQSDKHTRTKRILSRTRHTCHQEADKKLMGQIDSDHFDYSIMPGKHINIITNLPTDKLIENIIRNLT